MKSAIRAGLGTAGGELDAASNDLFMQKVKGYGSWEEPGWLVLSKRHRHIHTLTHTHRALGMAGKEVLVTV